MLLFKAFYVLRKYKIANKELKKVYSLYKEANYKVVFKYNMNAESVRFLIKKKFNYIIFR